MENFSERLRRTTVFLVALFLWLHSVFILNLHSESVDKIAYYLHLTASEALLLFLLVVLSFASGSGLWKKSLSLLYVYAFPFVLFWKVLYWSFIGFRYLHRWFKTQASLETEAPFTIQQELPQADVAPNPVSANDDAKAKKWLLELANFLLRPFRQFTLLWCILLLLSTHLQIVWVCLIVVVVHLTRRMFILLSVMLFFDPYLQKILSRLFGRVDQAVATIEAFTPEMNPSSQLKEELNQVNVWTKITAFLKNEYLLSRWAWVLGIMSFGIIYLYIALLFSFVYVGIARVSEISYPWTSSIVASLFIPLFATELPKTAPLRFFGGVHCVLVLTVGVSTFFSFLQRRVFVVRTAATVVHDKLVTVEFQQKVSLVGATLAKQPAQPPAQVVPSNREIKRKRKKKSS
jgi:hypothetical protein